MKRWKSSLAAKFLLQTSSKCHKSCPHSDSLPTLKLGIFVLKNLLGRVIHEPSPPRAPGLGMPSLPVVFAWGRPLWITKLEMYRWKGGFFFFPQIKLYTNRSLLNYPTNIPQTRQQKNQSTTKSTNTKWKSSGNYCNGNEGSGNKLSPKPIPREVPDGN